MTRSEFLRARIQPLITTVEKLAHPEDKGRFAVKLEVFMLRLIMDVEHAETYSDMTQNDYDVKYGDTIFDE